METYKIFSKHEGHKGYYNYAVKQGWSWPGFFFSFFWALINKMWALGIGVFVLMIVLSGIEVAIEVSFGEEVALGMRAVEVIIINVIFGVNGNKWREKNLISRGHDYKETVNAGSPDAAIGMYTGAIRGARAREEEDKYPVTQTPQGSKDEEWPSDQDDLSDRLRKLEELYQGGLITNDEYQAKRDQIIESL